MNGKVQHMGGNKDNMRQAMKELLGLVGFGPEPEAESQGKAEVVETPVTERPAAVERPVTAEAPKVEREPAVERKEQPKPVAEATAESTDLEDTRRKVATTVERSFFSFGSKEKEKEKEPVAAVREEKPYTPPVQDFRAEDDSVRAPFIRPGATVIAAGATFFGDIRAEGDVEVLGKLKGNLEATGNVRVVGKVLGDVKGEAVVLDGCTVQGNITSTSYVTLDAGAMVVGDVLATDFTSDGKVKGNLQIARAATFSSCALLAGNVIAATIVMAQGARVQGAVRIAEDPETNSLFGELEI